MTAWVDLDAFANFCRNNNPADLADLADAIATGCDMVDARCGPQVTTSIVEHVHGGAYRLTLAARPASLTSIVTYVGGTALTKTDFDFSGQVLFRRNGGWIAEDLMVTYSAGAATAPRWAADAAKLIGQQWWLSRLRPGPSQTPVGFLVPKQAEELMDGHELASLGFG